MDDGLLKLDPPIREGSIVTVRSPDEKFIDGYIGIVVAPHTWQPMSRWVSIPGIGEVETGLDRCYNATEAERKQYFKLVLKHGT